MEDCNKTHYICVIKINNNFKADEPNSITPGAKVMKTTKKYITSEIKSFDVTRICKVYKQVHGEVPTDTFVVNGKPFKHLDAFKVYKWAKEYLTSSKATSRLYHLLDRAPHFYRVPFCNRGFVWGNDIEPLRKGYIVNYLKEQCQDPTSNYAKRPILGHTHLYFCSPVYGHKDYNKWCALPIEGNEAFCEAVIKYANKFFN